MCQGLLNQNELSFQIDHFITIDPNIEHLHNQLVAGIYANVTRDPPEPGVAPWVSANDKPTVLSKPVSGDAAEQRLKTEVMQLPPRERRRIKEVLEVSHMLIMRRLRVIEPLCYTTLCKRPDFNMLIMIVRADRYS